VLLRPTFVYKFIINCHNKGRSKGCRAEWLVCGELNLHCGASIMLVERRICLWRVKYACGESNTLVEPVYFLYTPVDAVELYGILFTVCNPPWRSVDYVEHSEL